MTAEYFDNVDDLIKKVNDSADNDNAEDLRQETKAIEGNGNGKAKEIATKKEPETHLSILIKRSGFILEIERTGASVTFYAYDKDKTFDAIISKCRELGLDLTIS